MLVEETLDLTVEELYEKIGQEMSVGVGLGEVEPEEYENRGRRWLNKYRQKLQETICKSQVAKVTLYKNRTWDQTLLIAAIADLLASLSLGVSPVVVAALLVKEGLSQLCLEND